MRYKVWIYSSDEDNGEEEVCEYEAKTAEEAAIEYCKMVCDRDGENPLKSIWNVCVDGENGEEVFVTVWGVEGGWETY